MRVFTRLSGARYDMTVRIKAYSVDSWINKRPKDQTVNTKDWWRGREESDRYDRKAEAQRLKEARANIRALTPPADEETIQEQIAA
jgi:hypothetical protein